MDQRFELISRPNGIPEFRSEDHVYRLLNRGLDIEADGVIYHLSSKFAGDSEMGAVIDRIELERNRSNSV